MNAKFIRGIPAAMMLMFASISADADTASSMVVIEKDGTTTVTPIIDVSRVDFDTFSFSVLTEDGNLEKYDYDKVDKISLSSTSGITLPQKDVRLAVWPTLTTSTISVMGTEAADKICIFSLNGTQMLSVKAIKDVNVIDVASLPPGQYVLRAGENSVRFIKK